MSSHLADEELAIKVKEFWHSTGKYLLGAVIVGLVISFGWRFWKNQQAVHAQQASSLYESVLDHQGKQVAINEKALHALLQTHSRSVYASMAQLDVAAVAMTQHQQAKAIAAYKWVIANAKETGYQTLARTRLARLYLNDKHPEQALSQLNAIAKGPFRGMVALLKAQAYDQQGKKELAKQSRLAAKESMAGVSIPEWISA